MQQESQQITLLKRAAPKICDKRKKRICSQTVSRYGGAGAVALKGSHRKDKLCYFTLKVLQEANVGAFLTLADLLHIPHRASCSHNKIHRIMSLQHVARQMINTIHELYIHFFQFCFCLLWQCVSAEEPDWLFPLQQLLDLVPGCRLFYIRRWKPNE